MPGPAPKDPAIRQRQNVKSESAELHANPNAIVPDLPNPDGRTWHKLALSWWDALWKSPMAVRYLPTDEIALGMVAMLVDDFYKAEKPQHRLIIAAEIRQQAARFGLSNWDRNRMNWTIADKQDKQDKPEGRAATQQAQDPRKVLRAV